MRTFSERLRHLYFILTRPLTLGVRAAIKMPENKFVFVKHTYMPGWHFPGGGLEKNEVAQEAMLREVEQEVGIKITSAPSLFAVFFNRNVSIRDHILLYICTYAGDLPAKSTSFEIAEIAAFAHDDLPEDIDPGTARRVREIMNAEQASANW